MDTSQYMNMFLEESMDNLQTLNEALLYLEQSPHDVDKLNEIFRVAHTIKGMAATMGFSDIAELTHKMEDVLSKFREGKLKVTEYVVTILFECLDTLEKMVNNIENGNDEAIEIKTVMAYLDKIANEENDKPEEVIEEIVEKNIKEDLNEYDISVAKQAIESGMNVINVNITLSQNTILKSARAFLIVQELEAQGEILKSIPSTEDIENEQFDLELYFMLITSSTKEEINKIASNISEVRKVEVSDVEVTTTEVTNFEIKKEEIIKPKEIVSNKKEEQTKVEKKKDVKKAHQSVRVDLDRIDKLMNMVSELVIYRTRLEQIVIDDKSQELVETLEQVERTTSELQELVMKIRMLPLEVVFNRFPRMIRDLSLELNRDIDFVVEGAQTELDRTVIDEIGEPLIHLLRNAADHGIESREARIAQGKNPQGTIKLIAYQEGTKALIKVTDDGAGINVEKVRAKAEKVGINTEGMRDNDLKNLIFAQGFSTNEVVTDVSGRGVGMDVVKTKISALGGSVEVVSEEGVGSTFIIKLPLTLQIIQALLVKVGNETLAISLGFIDRVIDYKEENIKKTNGEEVIVYREEIINLIRLNNRLGIDSEEKEKSFIIIVKVGGKTVGLLVDSLLGQQEIVIKPLGKTLSSLKEYIGATILGNGLVTLILDVAVLI
ncbi:chemotaxis protein CheA [Clostridium gasigenes]|uniref:Chemotaxis protein CheA n=1 Tax=Clostridium gasigenes TaxID=94869 RepID=A0A7X0SE35_9CLOT|nr:chemotaxis protein CheA [Clostridium gasigenes]MBB6715941.1 chemotaxis protein CheA [Clostridium gasigenes]